MSYTPASMAKRVFPTEFDPDLLQQVITADEQTVAERNLPLPAEESPPDNPRLCRRLVAGGEVSREHVRKLAELACLNAVRRILSGGREI